jgi:hypothetical protein
LYIADVLDIDETYFKKHNLTWGNKHKLLIISRELSSFNTSSTVRFIVDRDADHWLGSLEEANGLVWTDYCDIETYFYEEAFVRKLIVHAGKSKIAAWDDFFVSFGATLKTLFAARVAAKDMGENVDYIKFCKLLTLKNDRIEFDHKEYIVRCLRNSGLGKIEQDFFRRHADWEAKLVGDHRMFCRGHDFISLVAWSMLKLRGGTNLANEEAIERILVFHVADKIEAFVNLL